MAKRKKTSVQKEQETFDNIFMAFNALADIKDSDFDDDEMVDCKAAMDYLCQRLELTPFQIKLLTGIMLNSSGRCGATIKEISRFMKCSGMIILAKSDELEDMVEKRIIVEDGDDYRGNPTYSLSAGAMAAFKKNEAFHHTVPECIDEEHLIDILDQKFTRLCKRQESTKIYREDIEDIIKANKKIDLAAKLGKIAKTVSRDEWHFLVALLNYWLHDNNEEVSISDIDAVFETYDDRSNLARSLKKGRSELIRQNLVQSGGNDGIRINGIYRLTNDCKKRLLPSMASKNESMPREFLRENGKIVEKQMFYNPGEREQVERLSHLLMPDETKRVLQRLKERDMRCGFCCLLYGGPGTGKTETVNQLARLSGRDIFTVEISSMRSKWYGETEQIVRNLFKQYHQCVEKSAVAPILFFNEADAVFGRRIDNVMRSVDKTENAIQNIILQEMEVFEGVMIATTNLATSLDPAFERRFLFKMELSQPNAEVKARLWKSMLPSLSDDDALQLAKTYNFSGGQIENISRKCTVDEVLLGKTPDLEQIKTYCNEERIVSHKGNSIGFARA